MIYGYCRVSTKKQSIERQIRNIQSLYSDAIIVQEAYTGTSLNRPEWTKLRKRLRAGDCVVFDSVSRMSRDAESGFALYKELFEQNVELIFLNERHIDTKSYQEALDGIVSGMVETGDSATDDLVNSIMSAVNRFMMKKVEADIRKAFEQSEKEVADLRKRTIQGLETARRNNKQLGLPKGTKLVTKKQEKSLPLLEKYSNAFQGSLGNEDCMRLIGLSPNTFYKYKSILEVRTSNRDNLRAIKRLTKTLLEGSAEMSEEEREIWFASIDSAETVWDICAFITPGGVLSFYGYVRDYLGKETQTSLLRYAWIDILSTGEMPACSVKDCVKWFAEANGESLMDKEDYEAWMSLPEWFSLYRIETEDNPRNPQELQWTRNKAYVKQIAKSKGLSVQKVDVSRYDVLAIFSQQKNMEYIVDTPAIKKNIKTFSPRELA